MKALIDKMVDRFLGWKLPKDFSPDAGISFKPTKPYEGDELGNSWWPIGTNLLTSEQARTMIEYMLTDAVLIPCEEVSQVATVGNVIAERNDYKARALSYEAANMEQGKLLNEVIAQRDELLAALSDLCDIHDKAARVTIEQIRNQEEFGRIMDAMEARVTAVVTRARAAIAKSKP